MIKHVYLFIWELFAALEHLAKVTIVFAHCWQGEFIMIVGAVWSCDNLDHRTLLLKMLKLIDGAHLEVSLYLHVS